MLYRNEHSSCFNYQGRKNNLLQIIHKNRGELLEEDINETVLIFFIEGKCSLSYNEYDRLDVPEGKIVLLPPGTRYRIHAKENIHIVTLKIKGVVKLCECMSIERLYFEGVAQTEDVASENKIKKINSRMLDIDDDILSFITNLCKHYQNGLRCIYYLEVKTKELFFLFRAYYSKEQLSGFFSPLLSSDARFTFFVYNNYRKVGNLQELISLSNYSESTFKKSFKKTFGVPASVWLRKQKATLIFHDLNNSQLSIKEISNKYHFAAVSSFSTFCIQNFGQPPGKIRSRVKKAEKAIETLPSYH